jgi:ABC-2 type transport system ATP-binding protein
MIRIEGLTKNYGATQALRGVSFEVFPGEVVGFLGPNAAGKSTTMKILAGYLAATSGRAFVGGVDVAEDSVRTRRMIGYLAENNPLYEEMMVVEFLEFVADVRRIAKKGRADRIRVAVDRCGLRAVLGQDIGQLSKGYRQRVGLAQAILHDPDLLILDEPTSGLDPNQIAEIRNLIRELGREKTIILCTHILSEVQTTCSRVLIINDGKLVADDHPDRLSTKEGGTVHMVVAARHGGPLDPETVRGWFAAVPGVSRVELAPGEGGDTFGFTLRYSNEDPRRALFDAVLRHELALLELRREHVSLEETFRRLTAGEGGDGAAATTAENPDPTRPAAAA